MLIAIPPDVPPQEPPVVVRTLAVSQANNMDLSSLVGEMGSCMVSPTSKRLGVASSIATTDGIPLYPEATALRWFPDASQNVDLQAAAEAAPVQIMKSPAHGSITFNKDSAAFLYRPNVGYVGDDMVVFVVDIDGRKIRVTSVVKVLDATVTTANLRGLIQKHCPNGNDWRIPGAMMPNHSVNRTPCQLRWQVPSGLRPSVADYVER